MVQEYTGDVILADEYTGDVVPVTSVKKTPMDVNELEKEAVKKGQVYVEPAFGLSAKNTANLYSFAERASASVRGIQQFFGFGEDEEGVDTIAQDVQKRQALENNPNYSTGAKVSAVAGMIADPVTYALPMAKAKTMGQFVLQSAYMGGVTGGISAKTEEESRVTNAAHGAIGGAVGGAVLGPVIRAGGKMFGKDWLPWKATPEQKVAIVEDLKKTSPDINEAEVNHFLNAPEDAHINARAYAEHLIKIGASSGKVQAAIDKNPLIGTYLDNYRSMHEMVTAKFTAGTDTPRVAGEEAKVADEATKVANIEANVKAAEEAGASREVVEPPKDLAKSKEEVKAYARLAEGQKGGIDPKLATEMGSTVAGVTLGAALNPEDPWSGALVGGMAGAAGGKAVSNLLKTKSTELLSKVENKETPVADFFNAVGEGADKAAGWLQTRLANESPELARHALDNERRIQKQTFDGITGADKFFTTLGSKLKKQKEDIKGMWLNGDRASIERALVAHGDKEATASFKEATKTLDKLGEELRSRGLIKGILTDYLPRIVKDREGLLKALGTKQRSALEEMLRKEAIAQGVVQLDDVAASVVINKFLRNSPPPGSGKPTFTKNRALEAVAPELQKFYHDPTETFHSYVSRAVSEINTHDFFGKSAIVKDGVTDLDGSIGNVLNQLRKEGKIKDIESENRIRDLLETRYKFGNQIANKYVQGYKNWTTGILLADVSSSVQNIGDVALASFHYGLKPTLSSIAQTLTGKNKLSVEDFGLVNHISEEFISSGRSKVYVDKVMKLSGWQIFDPFGKEVALNASKNRAMSKATSDVKWLETRYKDAFGSDFPQLVADLKEGKVTDLVKSMTFLDVARHQPLTRMQKTELATKNPNLGGLVYQFKSFMLGQANLIRTEAYNKVKSGYKNHNVKEFSDGLGKLAMLGMGFAAVGASNKQIQNWLLNRDEPMDGVDMFWNATRQFGLSEYTFNKAAQGDLKGAVGSVISPPTALLEGWTKENAATGETEVDKYNTMRKIPVLGKEIAGRMYQPTPEQKALEKRIKAERTRIMNKEMDDASRKARIEALSAKLKAEQRKLQQGK